MRNLVLVPGAGGSGSYWSLVAPIMRAEGHDVLVIDLPGSDPDAALREYAEIVADAVEDRTGIVLVAQSLGAFTAAMVSNSIPVEEIVLVNPMIPLPHETPGAWWDATGAVPAREAAARSGGWSTEFDVDTYFLHDVPPSVLANLPADPPQEADAVFASTCEFERWPDVPIRVLSGTDDRFFPADFQRSVARSRLHITPELLPGGHLLALAQPEILAAQILASHARSKSGPTE